jgi:hypothetical protein
MVFVQTLMRTKNWCQQYWFFYLWPEKLVKTRIFGSKTTTPKLIGLILPFFFIPEKLQKKSTRNSQRLEVDNTCFYYAWKKNV